MASNPRKGQAEYPDAQTTSHDGRAGHVMTCVYQPSSARNMANAPIARPCRAHVPRQLAERYGRLNCQAKQFKPNTSSMVAVEHGGPRKPLSRETSKQNHAYLL